uniref:Uncharacterized protein n=1 Tax=Rhizophora mucronata TaxID=61149 RepID=A0A2P2P6G4_RHIMU
MLPCWRSFSGLLFGCSNVGVPCLEFTSFFPTFSMPTPNTQFLTSSSYNLALSTLKKSAHTYEDFSQ